MSVYEPAREYSTGRMLSVLRVVAGLVLFSAGTMKMFGVPHPLQPIPAFHPGSMLGMAAILEVIGGIAITIGLFTRPVAFVLAGEMAVAYFKVHFPQSPFPTVNNGMLPVLFCFLFLYFCFAGAGPWSLDHLLAKRRPGVRGHHSHAPPPEAAWAGTRHGIIIGRDLKPIVR